MAKRKAFDGEGARIAGGRWNPAGYPAVYAAESRALCALEILVHADPSDLAAGYVCFPLEIPSGVKIERFESATLPSGWRRYPAPARLQQLGRQWLERAAGAVLSVPSAMVPEELNYVLNPAHPAFQKIRIHDPVRFDFDPRLRR